MLSLDDPRWRSLALAYGDASDIPDMLRQAQAIPPDNDPEAEPYFSLWSALCHQLDIYSASYAALPHLIRIVEENAPTFRWTVLGLALAIEIARQAGRGPNVPEDLREGHEIALTRIPIVAALLLERPLDELELRVVLAACAAAKGFGPLADAIVSLEPETVSARVQN